MSQSRASLLFLAVALAATAFWARRSPASVVPTASSTASEPTASGTAIPAFKEPFMPRTIDADELHWVGFYEGFYGDGPRHSGGVHPVGNATVKVNRPGKKVGLVLTAYEPIWWNIELTPGTQVSTVILSGYYMQHVSGLSPATPVFQSSYESPGQFHYFYAYDRNDTSFAESETMVRQLTGLKANTFHGAYAVEGVVEIVGP